LHSFHLPDVLLLQIYIFGPLIISVYFVSLSICQYQNLTPQSCTSLQMNLRNFSKMVEVILPKLPSGHLWCPRACGTDCCENYFGECRHTRPVMTVYQFFETHRLAFLVRLWSLAPEAARGYPLRGIQSGNTAREYDHNERVCV